MRENRSAAQTSEVQSAIEWGTVPCDFYGSTEAVKLLDGID
jgi:hypothetical protein